jgi:hypothetical protein
MAKSMFDSRIPQIEGGSGSVVVVRTCVVLEVGLTESRTFVWVMICVVGGGVPMVHRLDICCGH